MTTFFLEPTKFTILFSNVAFLLTFGTNSWMVCDFVIDVNAAFSVFLKSKFEFSHKINDSKAQFPIQKNHKLVAQNCGQRFKYMFLQKSPHV
jgi:hypothetical protein